MGVPCIGFTETKEQRTLVKRHGFLFPAHAIKYERGVKMNTSRVRATFAEIGEVSDCFGFRPLI